MLWKSGYLSRLGARSATLVGSNSRQRRAYQRASNVVANLH